MEVSCSSVNNDLIKWCVQHEFRADSISIFQKNGVTKISELFFLTREDIAADFKFLNYMEAKKLEKLWQSTVQGKEMDCSDSLIIKPVIFLLFCRLTSCSVTEPINQWHQIAIPERDLTILTYNNVLENFFDAVKCSEDMRQKVLYSRANKARIRIFPQVDGGTPLLITSFTDIISAVSHHYKYISFDFRALKHPNAIPINPLETIMKNAASKSLFYPELIPRRVGSSTDFKADVFNSIVGKFQQSNLGVSKLDVDALEGLLRTVRDILVLISGHVDHDNFPEIFQHNLKKADERERGSYTQDNIKAKISNLDAASISCSTFLAVKRFKVVQDALSDLREIMNQCVIKLCKNLQSVLKSQSRTENDDHTKIHGKKTREPGRSVLREYLVLNGIVQESSPYAPMLITSEMIDSYYEPLPPEENLTAARQRRCRWRKDLSLANAVSTFSYQIGSSFPTICVLWRVPNIPQDRDQTSELRAEAQALKLLPTYLNRQFWRSIKDKYGHAFSGSLPAGGLRFLIKEITHDSSKTGSAELDDRILAYCMSQGDPDLYPDLRAANSGRQRGFDQFFEVAGVVVDEITGASPYRHGEARVVQPQSSQDLISKKNPNIVSIPALHKLVRELTLDQYPEAQIPSIKLLEISLCPQYPSYKVSKRYTSRIKLSHNIGRATMRKFNRDAHYNHVQNIYANSFVVELNEAILGSNSYLMPTLENNIIFSKGVTKISVDDKGRIPVGEPGCPVRTNVRARSAKIIAEGLEKEKNAVDHDYNRATVRCSMMLICKGGDKDWRKGQVICSLKEGITQHSTALRHGVEMVAQLKTLIETQDKYLHSVGLLLQMPEGTCKPYGLQLRADGGGDRNPKHASVIIALLILFLSLDLDFVLCLITAADISAVNEVEGVMPVANFALQHQAFDRAEMPLTHENALRNSTSANQVRNAMARSAEPDATKAAWRASIQPVISHIENRISQMTYTNKPIKTHPPAEDTDIESTFNILKERVDATLTMDKTTKQKLADCKDYQEFVADHVWKDRYSCEIRKCGKSTCKVCYKVRMPKAAWETLTARPRFVPLPKILSSVGSGEEVLVKYHDYHSLKDSVTTPNDRPSFGAESGLNVAERRKLDVSLSRAYPEHRKQNSTNQSPTLWHGNNVRGYITCAACNRSRLIYAWPKEGNHCPDVAIAELYDLFQEAGYEYECGDALFGMEDDEFSVPEYMRQFHVQRGLSCKAMIQKAYFTSPKKFPMICISCATSEDLVHDETLKKLIGGKTPFPLCSGCLQLGKDKPNHGICIRSTKNAEPAKARDKAPTDKKRKDPPGGPPAKSNQPSNPSTKKQKTLDKSFPAANPRVKQLPGAKAYRKVNVGKDESVTKKNLVTPKKEPHETPMRKKVGNVHKRNIVRTGSPVLMGKAEDLLLSCGLSLDVLDTYEVLNVAGDGNCCCLVIQQYLFETGKETDQPITEFRRQLATNMVDHRASMQNPGINKLSLRVGGVKMFESILHRIFREGTDYTLGCPTDQWCSLPDLAAMLVLKYRIQIKLFTSECGVPPTHIYWDEAQRCVEHRYGPDVSCPTGDDYNNVLTAILDSNHYVLLRPRTWTDVRKQLNADS